MAIAATSALALLGFIVFLVAEIQQGREASGRLDENVSAVASVTALMSFG